MKPKCSEGKEAELAALYRDAFEAALAIGRPDLVEALVESIVRMVPRLGPTR
jgi:hypothetical protein